MLTNDPKVKPETRAKVEQVIAESGYVPSKSAQTMRGGSQKVVGIIISRLDSPSENKAVSTMLQAFYAHGYDVVIMESQFSRENQCSLKSARQAASGWRHCVWLYRYRS